MSRTIILAELSVFISLSLSIYVLSAFVWDETPRGVIVLLVLFSLGLGYHTSEFLNRFNSED